LITSTILTLEIVPAIYSLWRGRQVQWVKGPPPPKKSWDELSLQFAEWERSQHGPADVTSVTPAEQEPSLRQTPQLGRKLLIAFAIVAVAVTGFFVWKKLTDPASAPAETSEAASAEPDIPALPPIEITPEQQSAMNELLRTANAATDALASDSLQGFNEALDSLRSATAAAAEAFPEEHPWLPLLQRVRSQQLQPAGDLEAARSAFLPFSTALVELVRVARQQNAAFAGVKVYRCPMAPKPGLWIQLEPPLRNPYFGEEMLECGTEVAR
jgi:uncharacterized membrane protein